MSALANIVKSSLGPTGLDKMLVDDLGDVSITNDGATILKQLDVVHPAAKVLVELSNLQDQEVGDGTTSVVLMAAELLRSANELVKQHVHATSIISGFTYAKKEACKFIKVCFHTITSITFSDSNSILVLQQYSYQFTFLISFFLHLRTTLLLLSKISLRMQS